jgi:hypothetical protein
LQSAHWFPIRILTVRSTNEREKLL